MSVELIAEVASNHGGDLELAKAFIWQCAEAGATFVKFQSYQVRTLRPNDPQREWLAAAELSDDAHHVLIEECAKAGVQFLTTVFHASRVPFLASLKLPAIKVGSGEAGERTLVHAIGRQWPRIFVSTGLPDAIDPLWESTRGVTFFHCVSRYPHPSALAQGLYDETGYSDHSIGNEGCQMAICHGATIIEKHVQLPEQKRPGKPWEATMTELRALRQFADEDPARFVGRWQHGA